MDKSSTIGTKLLVNLSSISYEKRGAIQKALKQFEAITFVCHIEGANATGFVVDYEENAVIIVFRGTASMAEMLKNLDIRARYTIIGEIPNYLAKAFGSIDEESLNFLIKYCTGKNVILTGHSKGGGLAVMAAAFLALNGVEPKAVITFGSPRTGGDLFVSWREKNLKNTQCVNHYFVGNPVTYWPPKPKEIPVFLWRLFAEIIAVACSYLKEKFAKKNLDGLNK